MGKPISTSPCIKSSAAHALFAKRLVSSRNVCYG